MRITNQPITPPMAQIITVSRLMGMSSASMRLVRKRRITPSMALMMSLRIQSPLGISSCHPRREAVVAPGQNVALRPFLLPSFTGLPINNVLGNSEGIKRAGAVRLRLFLCLFCVTHTKTVRFQGVAGVVIGLVDLGGGPLANAGIALTANIAAIGATTATNMIMRLNALPVTVCCCPITSSFFDRWVFALHLDPDSKRHEAHRPKDQFLVGQSAYYYVGFVPIWRLEGSLMHPAAERGSSRKPRRKKRARVTLLPNPALLARSHPRASGGKRREAGERKR